LSKSCQKVVKSCQKTVKKLSKSCQKVVKKLSKSCQKLSKNCQKVVIKSCPHRPNTENLKEEATKNRTSSHLVQKEETTKNGMKNEERVMKNEERVMKKLGIRRLDATSSHLVKMSYQNSKHMTLLGPLLYFTQTGRLTLLGGLSRPSQARRCGTPSTSSCLTCPLGGHTPLSNHRSNRYT
jgi:hypothetical protein